MNNARIKKLQQALVKNKLDGFIVRLFEGDNQNILYLTGFGGTTGHLFVTRKDAYLIADARYWLRVEQEVSSAKLVKLQRGTKVADVINELAAKGKLTKTSQIGFESTHISVDLALRWKKEIKARLVPTVHLIERFRQYKDADEIALIRKGCRATCLVYDEVAALIEPGMTENEVAFEIDMRLRKHGAIANSFTSIVASGPNSAIPHHATGKRKLKAGEPVIMDFGGLYPGGYCSDITRTVFVPGKKPSAKMKEIYNVVLEANKKAAAKLKPGMKWKAFDAVARDHIAEAGYGQYFTHGLGHSVGLLVHDPFDYENDGLNSGTIITDEPGIYIEGLGGVRIEDDLVVTAGGCKNLTPAPYWKF